MMMKLKNRETSANKKSYKNKLRVIILENVICSNVVYNFWKI